MLVADGGKEPRQIRTVIWKNPTAILNFETEVLEIRVWTYQNIVTAEIWLEFSENWIWSHNIHLIA